MNAPTLFVSIVLVVVIALAAYGSWRMSKEGGCSSCNCKSCKCNKNGNPPDSEKKE